MTARRPPAPIRAIVWLFKAVFLTMRATFALALGTAVLGGLPWALVRFAGWPLPHHMLSLDQLKTDLTSPILGDQFYLNAIAIVLWFLWSILAFSFLLELAYAVRRIPTPHVPGLGPAQLLAGFLITAVGVTALLGRSAAPARADTTTQFPKARTAATAPATISTAAGLRNATALPTREAVHHVVPGDSLYKIAAEDLGDGNNWPALYKANAGVIQRDGQRLSDPNLIRPGWDITIPSATAPSVAAGPTPASTLVPTAPAATAPARPAPAAPTTLSPHGPSSVPPAPTAPASSTPSGPAAPEHPTGNDHPATTPSAGRTRGGGLQSGLWIELAAGGALAASTLLALRKAASRRHTLRSLWATPYWPRPGETTPVSTPQLPSELRPARTIALNPGYPVGHEDLIEADELDAFGAPTETSASDADLDAETSAPNASTDQAQAEGPAVESIAVSLPAADGETVQECDPTWIPVAVTGDGRSADLAELYPGLGLTGPGALGAARAIAATVLGSRSPDEFGSVLLIPRPDAALLLDVPESDVDRLRQDVWHLRIVDDLNAAVAYLADHAAGRAATLAEYGVPDFEALMQIDDLLDDPEPMVLLAVARGELDAHATALLQQPEALRLTSVLLGTHPVGANWRIDSDGEVTSGTPEAGVYAFDLSAAGLRAALNVVTTPWQSRPQIVPPNPLGPLEAPVVVADAPIDEDDDAPIPRGDTTSSLATAAPEQNSDEHVGPDAVATLAANPTLKMPQPVADPHQDLHRADPHAASAPAHSSTAQQTDEPHKSADNSPAIEPSPIKLADRTPMASSMPPVLSRQTQSATGDADAELKQIHEILGHFRDTVSQIRVLGPLTITTFTGPVEDTIRKGSVKLAALLALHHSRGRSTEELGVLWPDATAAKLPHIRKNDLKSLRDSLKRDVLAARGPRHGFAAEFVPRPSGRYRLDPHFVGVDLAYFEQLRALAASTHHPQVRRAAAEAALSLYGGELLEGMDEHWALAPRVAVRRDALATATLLAQLATDAGDDEQALSWWERAREIDDNEEVYRQIMKTQGRLGRRADIIATRNLLEQKLDPLGESASEATNAILAELLSERRGIPRERIGTP
ncbi:BTAD domain-containing putative transcriptional regulator [Catenulispora sp. GAS73]|uniref:BTAD domain-containing putative transcriptional regulator n=1 Tax=Catenulispora sp. GAS73 TaxID=3156269 RepID=UPI00351611A8